jgi:hypothetical protein
MVLLDFKSAGRLVDGHRHFAKKHFHLGKHALRDRLLRDRERGGVRRVAVDDGVNIGAGLVDGEVQ